MITETIKASSIKSGDLIEGLKVVRARSKNGLVVISVEVREGLVLNFHFGEDEILSLGANS